MSGVDVDDTCFLAEGYWRCMRFYLVAHLIASGVDSLECMNVFGYLEPMVLFLIFLS
jgi:hypothetical protein